MLTLACRLEEQKQSARLRGHACRSQHSSWTQRQERLSIHCKLLRLFGGTPALKQDLPAQEAVCVRSSVGPAKHGLVTCRAASMCQLCSTGSLPPACQAASAVLGQVAETDRAICVHVLSGVCATACKGRLWQLLLLALYPRHLHSAHCQAVIMRRTDDKRKVAVDGL